MATTTNGNGELDDNKAIKNNTKTTTPTAKQPLPKVRPEKEYQRRCLTIVESMLAIDDNDNYQQSAIVDELRLLDACRYITRGHYDDICTERSLCDQCGYPMCSNRLSKVRAASGRRKQRFGVKQVYKIDTNKNKIYRRDELEKFCGPSCLAASNYLRQQVSEEAVYLRTTDTVASLRSIHLYDNRPVSVVCGDDDDDGNSNDKHNANEINCHQSNQEPISEETDRKISANRSKVKSLDPLSYPYVREECLQQLRDQMIGLTISERLIERYDDYHNDNDSNGSDGDNDIDNHCQHIAISCDTNNDDNDG
ncbi:uncharacterized protein LOC128953913 [Oppia nitens]|uniref:uncharacterized protein LOC128953913 n=1 Tax=Oppia nitens TaxID=1686743 RepID=UPI0023DC37C4|nr:uncharacterized protein LOC128953913 [Oppia nitens]